MEFCGSKITFYRGDDDQMLVALSGGDTFVSGDVVYFSLKESEDASVDIFQNSVSTFVPYDGVDDAAALLTINHDDTVGMDLGKYFYDILIEWADGTFTTVIPPTRFTLEAGGSHDDREIP